jgi:hypothetical protein
MTESDKKVLMQAIAKGEINYSYEEYEETLQQIDGSKFEGDMSIMAEELYILGIAERHPGLAGAADPRYLMRDATYNEIQLLYRVMYLEQEVITMRRHEESRIGHQNKLVAFEERMRDKLVTYSVAV